MNPGFECSSLGEAVRMKLQNLVGCYSGDKCLYVEEGILKLLNFVFELKFGDFMKKQSIQQVFSFKFEDQREEITDQSKSGVVIFFLTPEVKWMRKVAEIIINNNTRNISKQYLLLLTPKKSFMCVNELEILHVKNSIKIESFNFGLIPFSKDIFSLEIHNSYCELFGKLNQTILQIVAESVLKLQYALGDFTQILGKGDLSNTVLELIKQKDKDESYEHHESSYNLTLVLIDRTVDLVTPMLTPFTYQGLLDNFYQINLNQILVPNDTFDLATDSKIVPYQLYNSLDETYMDITSTSIYKVEQQLKTKATIHKKVLQTAKSNNNYTITELNKIIQSEGRQYLFIQHHTLLLLSIFKKAKSIMFEKGVTLENDMIQTGSALLEGMEELAAFLEDKDWFRLICLASAVHGGIKQKTIRWVQEVACRMYSIQHAFTIRNMTQSGLLSTFATSNWKEIKDKFNLINHQEDSKGTKDYSYIYILNVSLITRMVEEALLDVEAWTAPKYELLKGKTTILNSPQSNFARTSKPRLTFVYVLGGVTYGQIHNLRQLGQKLGHQIIVCSTKIGSGKNIVAECFEL